MAGPRPDPAAPTDINHHLDHLTVVQDDFGDLIRIGDGDEVASVIHPVAPGAPGLYEYRLGSGSSIDYPGLPEPLQVQQVQVRPRNLDQPGFVGTLYIDTGSGAIVRMAFTFTAASYVDPYLDYIRISLDNGLWMGRYWLPYRQEVELRRELPQIDFMAGSIIRGRWEISEYEFDRVLPDLLFLGPRVTALPRSIREAHDFDAALFSDLEAGGLAPSEDLEEIEERARSMALGNALRGLAPVRLYTSSVSEVVRYNRAEGWRLGAGATVRVAGLPVHGMGGFAFGPERPWAGLSAGWGLGDGEMKAQAFWNRTEDLGPIPGASGLVNSIASVGGADYQDLYWTSGGSLSLTNPAGGRRRLRIAATVQEVRSAYLSVDDEDTVFRPVLPVDEGTQAYLDVALELPDVGSGAFGHVRLRGGTLDQTYLAAEALAGWSRRGPSRTLSTEVTVEGGWVDENAPVQELALFGGRGTLPGFAFRDAVADRYILARGWVSRPVLAPWVALRATAAAGWSELGGRTLPEGWIGDPDPGLRGSLGFGIDLLWETIRLDVARGIPDGEWTFFMSIAPRFHPWL